MIKLYEAFLWFAMFYVSADLSGLLFAGSSTEEISEQLDAKEDDRQFSDHIKVCQVGYLVDETKIAILTAEPQGKAVVRHSQNGEIVASLPVGAV